MYVDIDIISDTALPAGIVVCRPSTHTGCVLKLRVGVKSCVQPILEEDSSIPMLAVPYWYMDEEYGELGQPLCSESLLREHSLTTTSSQIEKKLQKHQKKRNHFTSLSKCIAGKLEELHDKKKGEIGKELPALSCTLKRHLDTLSREADFMLCPFSVRFTFH